ncbi:MAG: hemerythrin domain-containing protein [Bacteroidia bacterium]|nr:hemerythrin domain-containing protein [Bacteroidia bacterium]MCZ2248072.1 hemerythrin domain-containing protein [Bacteroidia bacterium]
MENKNLNIHSSIHSFTKEHHYGKLLTWKIHQGLKQGIKIEKIIEEVNWFWSSYLSDHFESEEQLLFPILGNDNELVKKAVLQHKKLRRLFEQPRKDLRVLYHIEEMLEQHIRFEEKVLYSEIQSVAMEFYPEQADEVYIFRPLKEWDTEAKW